jgi:hypothetical protein
MTRAIIGTGGTLTTLALITIEASTLTGTTVANTTTSTLGILVESTNLVGGIDPSKLIRALALGTITRILVKTNTPVIVTVADIISHASSVSGTGIVTDSGNRGHQGKGKKNLQHFLKT